MTANNWAYPGVKCVCVYDAAGKGQPHAAKVLKKGAIYTIVAMAMGDGAGESNPNNVDIAVRPEGGTQAFGPFNVQCFKPLVEEKKPEGMSVLQGLLSGKDIPADAPEGPVKEKAPEKQDA